MLKVENSRLLARKYNLALFKKDKKMINKILKIKSDSQVTDEIKNYK